MAVNSEAISSLIKDEYGIAVKNIDSINLGGGDCNTSTYSIKDNASEYFW
jgi:hypothetical protein